MMAESAATATPAQQAKNFALQSYFIVSTLIGNDFNWLVVFYHKIFMNSFYHSFKIICWNMHQIDRIVLCGFFEMLAVFQTLKLNLFSFRTPRTERPVPSSSVPSPTTCLPTRTSSSTKRQSSADIWVPGEPTRSPAWASRSPKTFSSSRARSKEGPGLRHLVEVVGRRSTTISATRTPRSS
jgi:hypothetical protein